LTNGMNLRHLPRPLNIKLGKQAGARAKNRTEINSLIFFKSCAESPPLLLSLHLSRFAR